MGTVLREEVGGGKVWEVCGRALTKYKFLLDLRRFSPRPAASPAGLTTANRMFPICAPLKCQNSGTPEFWWSIFFASKFSCEEDGLHQSRMFPTLAILNAPKSGTPDFGVKPGNDGNRGTSDPHPFDRDLL